MTKIEIIEDFIWVIIHLPDFTLVLVLIMTHSGLIGIAVIIDITLHGTIHPGIHIITHDTIMVITGTIALAGIHGTGDTHIIGITVMDIIITRARILTNINLLV